MDTIGMGDSAAAQSGTAKPGGLLPINRETNTSSGSLKPSNTGLLNVAYADAGGAMVRVFRLLSATVGVLAIVSVSAKSADDIKPPVGYRQWFHVNTMIVDKASPLFEALGGMHNVHVNSVGESALRNGGPYPDGTVFLTDLHDFSVVDGSYVEGALKGLALMAKDSKTYASTGGWGFQFWVEGDPKKPAVTDATKQCFECHQPKKDQDYVYSIYIP